jgi:hypothetical protein
MTTSSHITIATQAAPARASIGRIISYLMLVALIGASAVAWDAIMVRAFDALP